MQVSCLRGTCACTPQVLTQRFQQAQRTDVYEKLVSGIQKLTKVCCTMGVAYHAPQMARAEDGDAAPAGLQADHPAGCWHHPRARVVCTNLQHIWKMRRVLQPNSHAQRAGRP